MNNCGCFYTGKKVLITGGLGFIGLNASQRLLELGAEVTVLDYFMPPVVTKPLAAFLANIRVLNADFRDVDKVERVVRDQEVIFNLAGKSGAAESNMTPLNDMDTNCRGHLTSLEACRLFNLGVTIIFSSSRLVYGKPRSLPVFLKDCPVDPIDHFIIKAKKPSRLGVRRDGCEAVDLFSESSGKTAMQPR